MPRVAVFVIAALLAAVVVGVTIDDLGLTPEACAAIRANPEGFGTIPCECKLNSGGVPEPIPCYPSCCPRTTTYEGDRCHTENRDTWTVYEQTVCTPRPAVEYTADTPNCFYKGNDPVVRQASPSQLLFSLSLEKTHRCHNLFIASCQSERQNWLTSFRINTTDVPVQQCWLDCSPTPISQCTKSSCWAHRGDTHANIDSWDLNVTLPAGDYALVCQTLMQYEAVGSLLFQDAYSSSFFRIA